MKKRRGHAAMSERLYFMNYCELVEDESPEIRVKVVIPDVDKCGS